VSEGDRVAIYMPLIPEAAIAMLACARNWRDSFGGVRRLLGPRRSPIASTMPKRNWSSRPTPDGVAARRST